MSVRRWTIAGYRMSDGQDRRGDEIDLPGRGYVADGGGFKYGEHVRVREDNVQPSDIDGIKAWMLVRGRKPMDDDQIRDMLRMVLGKLPMR